ncbi:hypothetical protein TNCV_548851 [Trichonephila clavipes]|nr:hypothetical protein TNCV_548851 [Trichonephila clavipes]
MLLVCRWLSALKVAGLTPAQVGDLRDAENRHHPYRMIMRHVKDPLSAGLAWVFSKKLNSYNKFASSELSPKQSRDMTSTREPNPVGERGMGWCLKSQSRTIKERADHQHLLFPSVGVWGKFIYTAERYSSATIPSQDHTTSECPLFHSIPPTYELYIYCLNFRVRCQQEVRLCVGGRQRLLC